MSNRLAFKSFVNWSLYSYVVLGSFLIEASGTRAMNGFMKGLYAADFWISGNQSRFLISAGEHFLRASSRLALLSFRLKEERFGVSPKHHLLYHVVKCMSQQVDTCGYAANPILESCAMDEDLVGRVARVCRSVSPRATSVRTLERYLLQCREIWYTS